MLYVAIILGCLSLTDIETCALSTSESAYTDKAECEAWLAASLDEPDLPLETGYCVELKKPEKKGGGGI